MLSSHQTVGRKMVKAAFQITGNTLSFTLNTLKCMMPSLRDAKVICNLKNTHTHKHKCLQKEKK